MACYVGYLQMNEMHSAIVQTVDSMRKSVEVVHKALTVVHILPEVQVPLTCKNFIAEKGCVLLVEKLRGTPSCKQWLHGGEIQGFSCQNLSFCK